MFDTLFSSVTGDTLTLSTMLISLASSLVLGLFISMVYLKTHREEGYSKSFPITLIMLPAIICVVIMMIGNNVARAFSLAGAFSLIRFRSAPGDPKDIAYVFFALGVGLACGMGYIAYAVVFSVVLCAVMVILQMTNFAKPKTTTMQLKITVPENLNYQGLFDEVLQKYTDSWNFKKVTTSDFGTLFDLTYTIKLKTSIDQKMFLDELRSRNSNMNISLTLKEEDVPSYI